MVHTHVSWTCGVDLERPPPTEASDKKEDFYSLEAPNDQGHCLQVQTIGYGDLLKPDKAALQLRPSLDRHEAHGPASILILTIPSLLLYAGYLFYICLWPWVTVSLRAGIRHRALDITALPRLVPVRQLYTLIFAGATTPVARLADVVVIIVRVRIADKRPRADEPLPERTHDIDTGEGHRPPAVKVTVKAARGEVERVVAAELERPLVGGLQIEEEPRDEHGGDPAVPGDRSCQSPCAFKRRAYGGRTRPRRGRCC